VDKISLQATSALNNATFDYEGFSIRECVEIKILSIAANSTLQAAASNALKEHCNLSWPATTRSTSNENDYCLGMQSEQVFLLSQHSDEEHALLAANLAKRCIVTDQSDSWVTLEVKGARTLDVLERICPINLNQETFTVGSVARTLMEHLGVIVFRLEGSYLLLSARSSADSFLHSLTQSADFAL